MPFSHQVCGVAASLEPFRERRLDERKAATLLRLQPVRLPARVGRVAAGVGGGARGQCTVGVTGQRGDDRDKSEQRLGGCAVGSEEPARARAPPAAATIEEAPVLNK